MRTFHFDKTKYGKELLMDMSRFEETPHFFFSPEWHCTDFYEIMIFRRGNGFLQLDAEQIPIQNDTFLFVSPYQKRSWDVVKEDIKGYFLIFEKGFLANFFADKLFVYRLQYFYNQQTPTYFIPDHRLFAYSHDIFDEIATEIREQRPDSVHLLRSILYYMLIKMNRFYCQYHQLEEDTALNNYAYSFKAALEQHIIEKQRVADYVALMGISRISLNAAVKKQYGITASEMIKDRLIAEIKTALLFSTDTISEIAYRLHFSEPNNFIRFFKSKTGLSPKVFRDTYQIDSSFS